MKPRHAAALALVGWYLIAPWTSAENAWEGIMGPSISEGDKWATLDTFDTGSECKRALALGQEQAIKQAKKPKPDASDPDRFYDMNNARCIATDDPRLKGKTGGPAKD
jgi:hypothetical protein